MQGQVRAGSARGQVLEVQSEVSKVPGKVPDGWSSWVVPEQVPGQGSGRAAGKVAEDWGLEMHVWGQVLGKVTSSFTVTGSEWNCCRLQRSGFGRWCSETCVGSSEADVKINSCCWRYHRRDRSLLK